MKRLNTQDRVVAGASVIALISLFLPWYGASAGGFSASVSGFSTSYGWLGSILIIAAGAYLVAVRSQVDVSKMPLTPAVVVAGASLLGTIIVAIRWLTLPKGSFGAVGNLGFSYGPRIGIYLTIIVGVVQVVAAIMLFRTSGEALPWNNEGAS